MDRNRLERSHLPYHALFCAAQAGNSGSDRPHSRNFVEVSSCASGMSDRAFAAELIQAPALAMAFVAERCGESPGIEVSPARAVFVDDAVIGELRATELV